MDTALPLTTDMKLVLGLVVFTMVMFLFERIRADVVALVVLVLLGLSGLVEPELLFNGFSGNAVISIIATMILGAGLDRTGALNRLAGWLLRRANGIEQRLLLLTTAIAGLNSSFMQNPSVMALYMPVASRLSSRTGLSLPRLLLPKNRVKLLLNMLIIAQQTIPRGGTLTIDPVGDGEAMSFRVTAAGLNARVPQNIVDMLNSSSSAPDAHAVQPYYTRLLAQACGLKVTLAPEGETVVVAAS